MNYFHPSLTLLTKSSCQFFLSFFSLFPPQITFLVNAMPNCEFPKFDPKASHKIPVPQPSSTNKVRLLQLQSKWFAGQEWVHLLCEKSGNLQVKSRLIHLIPGQSYSRRRPQMSALRDWESFGIDGNQVDQHLLWEVSSNFFIFVRLDISSALVYEKATEGVFR